MHPILLLGATTFASSSNQPDHITHIGPTVLTLGCTAGFFISMFTAMVYVKGLWYLRRELQPARHAIGLLLRAGVCVIVGFSFVAAYNLFVAPSLGRF